MQAAIGSALSSQTTHQLSKNNHTQTTDQRQHQSCQYQITRKRLNIFFTYFLFLMVQLATMKNHVVWMTGFTEIRAGIRTKQTKSKR